MLKNLYPSSLKFWGCSHAHSPSSQTTESAPVSHGRDAYPAPSNPMGILLISLMMFSVAAQAAGSMSDDSPERGWFFYEVYPEVQKSDKPLVQAAPNAPKPVTQLEKCMHPDTWSAECGFVIPRTFGFAEQQGKTLIENMTVNANNIRAVRETQRFHRWAIDQALTASNTWQYNVAQNPEELGVSQMQLSNFGKRIITNFNDAKQQDLFDELATTSTFYYFTRSDCVYCEEMVPIMNQIQHQTGITLWNASLDKHVIPGFTNNATAPDTLDIAKSLGIEIVPTLYLHMPPNQWIRVATGVDTVDMILARLTNFVEAYRGAIITRLADGSTEVTPDFSGVGGDLYAERELNRYKTTSSK